MDRYLKHLWVIPHVNLDELIQPEFAASNAHIPLDQRFEIEQWIDPLTQWQLLDLQTYLPDDNLRKVDAMSMAFGIEVRVPLLDHRIVEFGLSLPAQWRCTATQGKIILRESMRSHLPPQILDRAKIGFKVPLRAWIRNNQMDDIIRFFQEGNQPVWRVVHRKPALKWLNAKSHGGFSNLKKIWSLVVLNAWLQQAKIF